MTDSENNHPEERPQVPPRRGSGKAGARPAAQDRRRRRRWIAGGAVVVVVVVIAVLVAVGVTSGGTKTASRTPVPPSTSHALQSVPMPVLVSASTKITNLEPATQLDAAALTSQGKPQFLYIGAEFCPVCATERWPMVVALSQFGTFRNLQQTHSAVRDGNIATLSFYGSSYSSPYLTFTPVETTTNQPKGDYYETLETPTPAEQSLWNTTLDGNLAFPFIDIGGKYLLNTSQFSPSILQGHSFDEIAASVGHNDTTTGANIDSAAASLVKYICDITGNKPAATCSAAATVDAPVSSKSSGAGSAAG